MAENYVVNYKINVDAGDATKSLTSFTSAVEAVTKTTENLATFQGTLDKTFKTLRSLMVLPKLDIDCSTVNAKLDEVIRKLRTIHRLAGTMLGTDPSLMGSNRGSAKNRTSNTSNNRKKSYGRTTAVAVPVAKKASSEGYGYKVFGHNPIPSEGGMSIDMMRGMGIAYGISGLGSMVSGIVEQASTYDNLMKTVENILKTHDSRDNFSGRFQNMSRTVRNVGMETKFTITEVADAAKFLAMAGLNLEAIDKSIRPIADIALVGDTDLGQTADLVTNIMTAYNISPDDMRKTADIMTNTFTMSNTTLTEIAESYKYAASLLSAGGVQFEEATAAIGVLGDAGIKGSQAGTTLRTIMANLANPTKKQQKAWEAIGVSAKDEEGNIRPLIDIFEELNKKELQVGDYYKLFHKTAASGAVALTDHVEKWYKVYLENFKARGLSASLADAKKNTLQGLWKQVESVFTDTGVTAFQSIEGGLRGYMNQAIDWLRSKRAEEIFRDTANTIMEFVKVTIDATKWFYRFYEKFAPMIKMWIKFQLVIWPVVKAIQAFRSAWFGLSGLRAISMSVSGWFNQIGTSATRAAGAATSLATANMAVARSGWFTATPYMGVKNWRGVKNGTLNFWGSFGPWAPMVRRTDAYKALKMQKDWVKRNERRGELYKKVKLWNTPMPGYPASWNERGIKAWQKSHPRLTEWYNGIGQDYRRYNPDVVARLENWRKIRRNNYIKSQALGFGGNMLSMGVGGLGMYGAISQITKADANTADYWAGGFWGLAGMSAMAGGPIGWIAAGVAGLAGFGAAAVSASINMRKLTEHVNDFVKSAQLIDGVMTNDTTKMGKLLRFAWQKNYDINQLIKDRIELAKELYGLQSDGEGFGRKDISGEPYKQEIDKFYDNFHWNSTNIVPTANAMKLFNSYGEQYGLKMYFGENAFPVLKTPDGKIYQYTSQERAVADALAAVTMMTGNYQKGIALAAKNKMSDFLYDKNSGAKDLESWHTGWNKQYSLEGVGHYDPKNNPNGFIYPFEIKGGWNELRNWTSEDIGKSLAGNLLTFLSLAGNVSGNVEAIKNFKAKKLEGTYTESDLIKAIIAGDNQILPSTLRTWDSSNPDEWFKGFGYYNNKFNSVNGNTVKVTAQTALEQMNYLLEALALLGVLNDPQVEALVTKARELKNFAEPYVSSGTSQTKNYGAPWMDNGSNDGVDSSSDTNTGSGSTSTGNSGASMSDYKNHYKSGSAAPKQVIVRIENLMNVEALDLSKSDKEAVVANLKAELGQALIDVVHDFDETWHG